MNETAADVGALLTRLAAPDALGAADLPPALGDPATLAAMAEECERRAIGETSVAIAAGERLTSIADSLGDPALRARVRRAYGQALAYANRLEEALALQSQAREIAADAAPLEAARAGVAMLHALARLGRLQDAVAIGSRAQAELASLGDPVLAAKADVNLGVVFRMLDRPQEAIEHFDRALPVFGDNPLVAAQVQSNRAEALLDQCNFADAERGFRDALGAFEQAGAARAASIAEGNLADLLARQGRHGPALHHFERARLRLEEAAARGDAARLWIEQAEAQFALGLPAEAVETYERAIPVLEEHRLAAELARAKGGLAKALAMVGRTHEAVQKATSAAIAFRELGQTTSAARTDLSRAQILLMTGNRVAGVQLAREAMRSLHDRPADLALGHVLIATAALQNNDARAVLVETTAGLMIAERIELIHLIPSLRHMRGKAMSAIGLSRDAAAELKEAAHELSRLRGTFVQDRFRAAFSASHARVFADAVASSLESGSVEEAFSIVQQAKGGSLLDLLAAGGTPQEGSSEESLAELNAALGTLRGLVSRLQDLGGGAAAERASITARIIEAERDIEAAESRMLAGKGYAELIGASAPLELIVRSLPADWAVAEFYCAGSNLMVFVLRGREVHAVQLGDVGPVLESIERLHFQTSKVASRMAAGLPAGSPRAMLEILHDLHAALIAPIAHRLDGLAGLVVAPCGPLHGVPFLALHNGEQHAAERFAILQCPSSSVMAHLAQRTPNASADRGPLIVSVPDPLAPAIAEEGAQLASMLPGAEHIAGPDATVGALRRFCDQRPLVHIAAHGAFTPGVPSASGMKLSDGWLTSREAAQLPLRNAVVTLSGCDTGRTAAGAGDELVGLFRSLLAAGASAVLGTLWPVHDHMNTELLGETYRRWYALHRPGAAGLATALQETCRGAVARGVHPALWSPYFVIGAPA